MAAASSRPVLIVGGGAAGLTLARCLANRGRAFLLFEQQHARPDRGLGLWGRAQGALRELGLQDLLDSPGRARYIPAAAYRSRSGDWLSRCSDTPSNAARVVALRESHLLEALEAGLPAR